MSQSEAWTVGRLLQWTTGYLKQQGADNPRLDAEVLLASALACTRIELYTSFSELTTDPVRAAFRELVRRRAEGTPVAYLVGRREFYSLAFRVTPAVLIPRPETELLVVRLLDLAAQQPRRDGLLQLADVGTGSGIIAICAARRLADARVLATDLSADALAVAAMNVQDHEVGERVELHKGDLLSGISPPRRFDFIVANLPYIASGEMDRLPRDVRAYEPRMALEAGPTGAEVIARLVPQAAELLAPGGWLLMEIGPLVEQPLRAILEADQRYELFPTVRDLAGLPRLLQARRTRG